MPSEATNKPESLRGRRGRRDSRESFKHRFHSPAYAEAVTTAKPQRAAMLQRLRTLERGFGRELGRSPL